MTLNKIKLFFTAGPILLASVLLVSCNSVYTPKRRGYFKIDFPPHEYQRFDQKGYPYSFEYPVYANIVRDTSFFEAAPENPWWINIDFPRFDARLYISYKDIGPGTDHVAPGGKAPNTFDKLRDDTYKMTFKHAYKASAIEDSLIRTPLGISGIFFNVGGNAATANQFYLTDTTRHFLRAALYFNVPPNEDSLGIVNHFLHEDMVHMINTFRWKSPGQAGTQSSSNGQTGTSPSAGTAAKPGTLPSSPDQAGTSPSRRMAASPTKSE